LDGRLSGQRQYRSEQQFRGHPACGLLNLSTTTAGSTIVNFKQTSNPTLDTFLSTDPVIASPSGTLAATQTGLPTTIERPCQL